MTFCPQWVSVNRRFAQARRSLITLLFKGSHALRTDNFLHKWVYLAFFNAVWVVVPGYFLWDSFKAIALALRDPSSHAQVLKERQGAAVGGSNAKKMR